jgi:hypothetical protein
VTRGDRHSWPPVNNPRRVICGQPRSGSIGV